MASASGVVTRFAPSPTGFLHIGGARTALFNWLYAKHTGGRFLLRIEDTDRARSTDAAIAAILDGLQWLGLDWEGEPVFQFARAERHKEVAYRLLESGNAYRCYSTPEELEAYRAEADAARKALSDAKKASASAEEIARLEAALAAKPRVFSSPYRDGKTPPAADAPFVIRLKAPREGETVVEDEVQGRVRWANKDLDDMVLLRSDGTPTYMLAVVVDDHDMGITHVIRGDDHLTNAARQKQIYNAMGWDVPTFAHIPLIHGPDGAKLSKRHGALGVDAYRAMGYLPDAMRNYLARLGWGHGDEEIFTTAQAADWFDLDAIGRSPSRFDFAKLENLNGVYIRNTPDAELVRYIRQVLPTLEDADYFQARANEGTWRQLEAAMPGLKERAKTIKELVQSAEYLVATLPPIEARGDLNASNSTISGVTIVADRVPIQPDEKAAKVLSPEARKHLAALKERFAALETWDAASIEAATRTYAEETGAKLGNIAQPLRAAATGRTVSPPVFDVLAVLGRDEALARIADQAA
ncbi:glutamyl-tRNA synthetase [Rhodomicrobium vannielii ATCC 17100]|uniref:Glutamate--tRNA ligase n=1 Tax=Rhodomicrobium vannielii (strain ATCC 17100 / DSM 162 / LMG 4299 / NCIMB 10020 / ATH 3.1.1) TaxID=648757 RepID=E3I1P7_RHOVT|nr:glutamate--tRNA ligase [Rhodomicrobium vannielii]ADP72422.1 glutamyl-tRNA synthetase [Rhodomicrobium vannielii ATCC 17100]